MYRRTRKQNYPILFAKADNPDMIKLSVEKLSYYSTMWFISRKSKAIYELSKIIIEKHQVYPNSFEYLEELPGVGHKTASVVMAQHLNSAFPVDTHIHRLVHRWKLTNGKNVDQTEKDLNDYTQKNCG